MMTFAVAAALAAASGAPVTVEIVTSGHIETPADRYRVSGSLLACAATQAEADRQLAQQTAAIERSMAALGATKANPAEKFSLAGMMGGMMSARGPSECDNTNLEEMIAAAGEHGDKSSDKETTEKEGAGKAEPKVGASASLSFDAPDRATATRAIAALKAADAKPSDKAVPVLSDDTAAKRAAKQQALSKARAEADAYGDPLGLGRVTLTGISERQDLGSLDFIGQMLRTIGLPGATPTDRVVTDVTLTVTFRLTS